MECKTGNPPLLTKAIILLNVFHLFCSVTQKPHKWHIIRLRLFEMQFVHVSEWRSKQHNHSSVWPHVVEVRKDRQTNKCIILYHFCSWEELIYHQSDGARTCMVPCGRLTEYDDICNCQSTIFCQQLIYLLSWVESYLTQLREWTLAQTLRHNPVFFVLACFSF